MPPQRFRSFFLIRQKSVSSDGFCRRKVHKKSSERSSKYVKPLFFLSKYAQEKSIHHNGKSTMYVCVEWELKRRTTCVCMYRFIFFLNIYVWKRPAFLYALFANDLYICVSVFGMYEKTRVCVCAYSCPWSAYVGSSYLLHFEENWKEKR
jgi:hypothetical protein